jgi:cytochrome c5
MRLWSTKAIPVLWAASTVLFAAAAFSARQPRQQMQPGEIIMNNSCLACHEYREIQRTALDKDGWSKLVSSMIEKGAKVKTEDLPVLVDYLVQEHGPLPEGSGKPIMLEICTMCHDLHRVKEHGRTRDEWEDLLVHMINEGAPLSDDEFPVLLNYLTRNFRPPQ